MASGAPLFLGTARGSRRTSRALMVCMLHVGSPRDMVSAEDGRDASSLKVGAAYADGRRVAYVSTSARLKETMMTPVALPPEIVMAPTGSSALVFQASYSRAFDATELREVLVGSPELPEGIDYDRWVGLVRPAPRAAFADSLDLVDYFDIE